jgi:hypothetical protein
VRAVRKRLPSMSRSWSTTTRRSAPRRRWRAGARSTARASAWLEEPVRHDDYEGSALLARTDRRAGADRRELLAGGRHARRARRRRLRSGDARPRAHRRRERLDARRPGSPPRQHPMSSHLYPEVSAHLLAATPTCHYLEYVDWAAPSAARAVAHRRRHGVDPGSPGQRPRMGRGRGTQAPDGVTDGRAAILAPCKWLPCTSRPAPARSWPTSSCRRR